jgi:methyl-accepting chemotaxis protein
MTSNEPSHSPDKLDILIDQVGHFTEGLTELRILVQAQAETAQKQLEAIDKQSAAIDKQSAAIDKQGERIDKLGDRLEQMGERLDQLIKSSVEQRQNIDRIANAMEASNRSQAEAINRLVAVVDRLLPPQA